MVINILGVLHISTPRPFLFFFGFRLKILEIPLTRASPLKQPLCGMGYGMAFSRLPYLISRNRFQGKLKSLYIVKLHWAEVRTPKRRLRWVPGVIRLIIEPQNGASGETFQLFSISLYSQYMVYINDFIHADRATVCRAECLGFPVAPNDVSTNLQHSPGRGAALPWKYLRQPLANILYFFLTHFYFFAKGLRPALGRAAAANKKQKKKKNRKIWLMS